MTVIKGRTKFELTDRLPQCLDDTWPEIHPDCSTVCKAE